jgi:hypothetical protein
MMVAATDVEIESAEGGAVVPGTEIAHAIVVIKIAIKPIVSEILFLFIKPPLFVNKTTLL